MNIRIPGIDKLVEFVLSDLVGPKLASWKSRKIAEGDVEGAVIRAEGVNKVHKILKKQDADDFSELELNVDVPYWEFQEKKRLHNMASVVEKAAGFLGDKVVPDEEPDHDWTARFFNYIKDISTEEMQILWAKVLAGEVERAGSTSLLTLDVLRNIDRETASAFRIFCSASIYITDGTTIYDARVPSLGGNVSQNSLSQYGLGYVTLVRLNEHGLVVPEFNSWYEMSVGWLQRSGFVFQGNTWLLNPRESIEKLKMHGVAMTASGKELSRIVEIELVPDFAEALHTFYNKNDIDAVEVIKVPVG